MKQISLAATGFQLVTKRVRERVFLDEMNLVVPWTELVRHIEPRAPAVGPKGGTPRLCNRNHVAHPLHAAMVHPVGPCHGRGPVRHPLYCEFARLDPGISRLPDESTILRFRHLPEANDLALQIMATVNARLTAKGLLLKAGTPVDATLIAAPISTKNSTGTPDPEMHSAKKGHQWHFCVKAHIGVDAESGLVHTVLGTAANVDDVTQGHGLLHGDEEVVFADAGYKGAEKRKEATGVARQVAMRPGKRRALDKADVIDELVDKVEQLKARVRAKVEHPFRVVKRQLGYVKVRYRVWQRTPRS